MCFDLFPWTLAVIFALDDFFYHTISEVCGHANTVENDSRISEVCGHAETVENYYRISQVYGQSPTETVEKCNRTSEICGHINLRPLKTTLEPARSADTSSLWKTTIESARFADSQDGRWKLQQNPRGLRTVKTAVENYSRIIEVGSRLLKTTILWSRSTETSSRAVVLKTE